MPQEPHIADIARVIQLAVAPVFLLVGIAATLGVLTNRLARIVDRARALESRLSGPLAGPGEDVGAELSTLSLRARFINRAITLITTCALLICVLVAVLFAGAFLSADLNGFIGVLFVVAMLLLIGGYVEFLREIFLATASLRIGPPPG